MRRGVSNNYIHSLTNIYIYIYISTKYESAHTQRNKNKYTYTYIHLYLYLINFSYRGPAAGVAGVGGEVGEGVRLDDERDGHAVLVLRQRLFGCWRVMKGGKGTGKGVGWIWIYK